jgi:hypothetical protein
MEEKTKYAENARKASKAYYDRKRQRILDERLADQLTIIFDLTPQEQQAIWTKTLAVLRRNITK